jgi:hypothetical protein
VGSPDTGAREPQLVEVDALQNRVRELERLLGEARAALAAGVGVPPDAALAERERAAKLQERLGVMVQASQEGYAIVDYDALDKLADALAGVGEARPVESPQREQELEALAETRKQSRRLYRERAEAAEQVAARLREQLDAARKALEFYAEQPYGTRARAALGDVAAAKLPSVDDHPGYDGDKGLI